MGSEQHDHMSRYEAATAAATEAAEDAGSIADRAREAAASAAVSAAELGREGAASSLERAAAGLEERVTAMGADGVPAMAAGRAAEGLQAAAGYLREHESTEMWGDLERYVKQHPMRALVGAIATGILVGRIFR